MTNIEKICAEIINLKKVYPNWQVKNAADDLLSFIESLEKEQDVDLEKEIKDCIKAVHYLAIGKEIEKICRHFYELGRNTKEKVQEKEKPQGLDEAAHEYAWERQEHHIDFDGEEYLDYGVRYDAFKAGAKWMAEQGVTVDGEICIPNAFIEPKEGAELIVMAELGKDRGFKFGDKVIVQIRKK